ncbi:MAG: metallophosphoesterase [Clostridiales bacterium]|nr:metallophosphoesterase [Clostridiales bacterium]
MFLMLFVLFLTLLLVSLGYLFIRIRSIFLKGEPAKTASKEMKKKSALLAAVPVAILAVISVIRPYIFVIPIFHLAIFWAIFDLIFLLVKKLRKGKKLPFWLAGALAVPITIVYMSVAYFLATHMYKTTYQVTTSKAVAPLRIALISDSHVGACFDGEGFADRIETIGEQHPDMLVIAGDFVDDDTKKEDMIICCRALGEMKTTYGVYYSPGNHDVGYSDYRDFTFDDLIDELEKNGVHVLLDEIVAVGDDYYIVGRKDKSMVREPISELTEKLDKSRYIIAIDHQPTDYTAEKEAGCDLVLSGHTHGGQMIPIRPLGELFGVNDSTYGLKTRGETSFIVSSGIASWAIPYKTGTISEYCIIDVTSDGTIVKETTVPTTESTTEETTTETTTEETATETTTEPTLDPNIDRTCFPYEELELPELTEQQQKIYDDLCEKISNFEPYFYDRKELGFDYMDDILYVTGLVEERHLEFRNYFDLKEVSDDEGVLSGIQIEYWCKWEAEDPSYDINDVKAGQEAFNKRVDEILSGLTDDMTAYEKYLYLAEQISMNEDYDYEGVASVQAAPWAGVMGGYSICAGYSAAMEYLCKKADLYCITISGLIDNVGHAWNLIKLPEGTYHVDVTWADGTGEVGTAGWYRYFALTQEQIQVDHIINDDTMATGRKRFITF